jgi:ferric-dicitrate binding protein FerR (iron transport regulator)
MIRVMIMESPFLTKARYCAAVVCKFAQGKGILFTCVTVFALFFSADIFQKPAFAATPEVDRGAFVTGITGAKAQLNGVKLISGTTLFRGDIITLGPDSSVALHYGNNHVLAAPETELVVGSEGVSLRRGRVQIRLAAADSFAVAGPFFRVNVVPSGGNSGSAEVHVGGSQAQVSAVAGIAELKVAGSETAYVLHAGDAARMDSASAGAEGGQASLASAAGQVSRLLPEVQIQRASQQMAASIAAPLYWNDDLHSGSSGRARVSLNDGSLLNLGSNSELRVLQHDAQAQQTSLDLAVGRMRGQVVKLSRPGAKFEIRTPTGVAGLVGTDFHLLAMPDYTELIVFEGAVRFTSFTDGQAVTVTTGMKVQIVRGGTIAGPSIASLTETQEAKDSTDVPQTSAQNTSPSGKSPRGPILISLGTGTAVTGISVALILREMSPSRP